jgi:prepilin-type processing-associated H-X9-DG protein
MKSNHVGESSKAGFTRIDLAFISGTIGMFLLLGASAMATSNTQSEATTCVNNNRELIDAWSHYAVDNNGLMAGVVHGGVANTTMPSDVLGATMHPWCLGWQDWTLSVQNTNYNLMAHPSYGSLALYVNRRKEVFRCPTDRYVSQVQASRGWTERARSYSANVALGDGNGGPGDGPWDPIYVRARRLSQLINPAPTSVYVFMEEHPDSMNDGAFQNPYVSQGLGWVDMPSNFHEGAATIAFADGRVEQKQWTGIARTSPVRFDNIVPAYSLADEPDVRYVANRVPKQP